MVERQWRFVDTGMNDAFLNMALDEVILETHLRGVCPPTVRVYGWSPPALSLGYFQDLEAEIEVRRCHELGIDLIRRMTGGRAVFHDDELTYSVVTSERYGHPKTLAESYKLLNKGLIAAYKRLGLEVSFEAREKWTSPAACFSTACFSSAGLADLTHQGRKLCGSAQFRRNGVVLQHGSLPITFDAQAFFSLLRFPSEAVRHRAQASYGLKTTSLREVSGDGTGYQQLRAALLSGFEDALGIVLREEPLTPEEWDLARQLAVEKYRSYGWNHYGRYEA